MGAAAPIHKTLFEQHNWPEWRALGYDNGSLIDVEPGFVDRRAGDFRLRADSPLPAIGFDELPMPICAEEEEEEDH